MTSGNIAPSFDSPALLAAEFSRLHQTCLSLQMVLGQLLQQPLSMLQPGDADGLSAMSKVMAVQSLDEMTQMMREFEKLFNHMATTSGHVTDEMLQLAIENGVELLSLRQRLLPGTKATAQGDDEFFLQHRGAG